MTTIITKYSKNENDVKTFNINEKNNKKIFGILLETVKKIESDGFKSNLTQSKKYPENLYFSQYDKVNNFHNMTVGNKYNMTIRTLKPNSKGFVNIKIVNYEELECEDNYVDYL